MKIAEETGGRDKLYSGFCVGTHRLASAVLLAPMSGVTDMVLRRQASVLGAGLVVSEMVASDSFVKGDEESRLRAEGAGILPHVVQLAGCDPFWMAEAAKMAEAHGADMIDINMGCPAKRVTGGWAGSALMRDIHHAVTLIEAVVGAVSIPVTVKMRLGWDENSLNAAELAQRAEASGAKMITVHGRTRQQFYKGEADWKAIAAVKNSVAIPVVANGDINTLNGARTCLSHSSADGVMVGRAAMGRAWLPGAIGVALAHGWADITVPNHRDRARWAVAHYQGLITAMGPVSGPRHARKHLVAYADDAMKLGQSICHSPSSSALKSEMLTSDQPDFVVSALTQLFEEGAALHDAQQAAA